MILKIDNNHTTLITVLPTPSTRIALFFKPSHPFIPLSGRMNSNSLCHFGCQNSFKLLLLSLNLFNENNAILFVFPWRTKT